MPTRVEEICKQIHILFAKGQVYQNSPDLVILSKTEMFSLLEQLNEAMYEVLDQYEASTRAKEKAKLETERQASEIIANARLGAEDVQAASLAYTDTMLDELSLLIENTKETIRNQYLEFLAAMDAKQEKLSENRSGLKDQLTALHDSDCYLELLNEVRDRRAKAADKENDDESLDDTKDADASKEKYGSGKRDGRNSAKNGIKDISKSSDGNSKAKAESDEFPPPPPAPSPVIRVNRPGENSGVTFTTRRTHNKKSKTAPPKSSTAKPMSEEEYNRLTPEQREALESSTPAYGQGYNADDFDLDAEYERFKEENEAAKQNNVSQKGGFKLFGKKKK